MYQGCPHRQAGLPWLFSKYMVNYCTLIMCVMCKGFILGLKSVSLPHCCGFFHLLGFVAASLAIISTYHFPINRMDVFFTNA